MASRTCEPRNLPTKPKSFGNAAGEFSLSFTKSVSATVVSHLSHCKDHPLRRRRGQHRSAGCGRGHCRCNVPDYGTEGYYDHALLLLLACRLLPRMERSQGRLGLAIVYGTRRDFAAALGIIGPAASAPPAARRARSRRIRLSARGDRQGSASNETIAWRTCATAGS